MHMYMAKTAKLIREDFQKHKSKFMGSFSANEMQLSIPSSLLHLVKMIEHGPDIKSQLENDRCKSDLTTAQLIMFNYHPNINKRTVQDILLRVKLNFLFTWGCLFMPKCDLPGAEPRGESICVGGAAMVNSKPPHKRLKLMRIMSFCHIKSQASKCSMVDIIFE